MRKNFLFVAAVLCMLSGCKYDDLEDRVDELENRLEIVEKTLGDMNSNISSLQAIVEAQKDGKFVSDIKEVETGYIITFSDGTKITLKHGKDGNDGSSPVIGVKEFEGEIYWTITIDGDTKFIENNGQKIPVSGKTPIMGVDREGYWTVDTGNGPERIKDESGNPVKATGTVESFIVDVVYTKDYVKFVFSDGKEIALPFKFVVESDDKPQAKIDSKGFYIVNEDWFGHDNGSVNYFEKNGNTYNQKYRVFRAANPGQKLGVTTCYGAIWGQNMYFVSKQDNRLVVADAKTMKSKKIIKEIGGDGRSFVGVDDTKAYIGYNGGIKPMNLGDLSLGDAVAGVSGQIGNMCISAGKVFAVSQKNLYIINSATDKVEKTVAGSYNSVVTAKDGNVWVATNNKFVVYNPYTLETKDVAYPSGASVSGSWGAWNPGGLCASTQTNTLYWTTGGSMFGGGNKICKYDIDSSTPNVSFYTIPNDEEGNKRVFYGAGLRIDPISDNVIIHSYRDVFGENYVYNWVSIVSPQGADVTSFVVGNDTEKPVAGNGYYWFPTMPVFEDANKPQILLNAVSVSQGEKVEIDLAEKIVDYDNTFASIVKKVDASAISDKAAVSVVDNKLVVESKGSAGNCKFKLIAVSNGVKVEKDIELVILSK